MGQVLAEIETKNLKEGDKSEGISKRDSLENRGRSRWRVYEENDSVRKIEDDSNDEGDQEDELPLSLPLSPRTVRHGLVALDFPCSVAEPQAATAKAKSNLRPKAPSFWRNGCNAICGWVSKVSVIRFSTYLYLLAILITMAPLGTVTHWTICKSQLMRYYFSSCEAIWAPPRSLRQHNHKAI